MKIIAILEDAIGDGGAFHQGLNAIRQMQKIALDKFEFEVITFHPANISYLEKIGVSAGIYKKTWVDKVFCNLMLSSLLKPKLLHKKIISSFEKHLQSKGVDFVYFLSQSSWVTVLVKTPYISTVFDICYRDFPEFPEVREHGVFYYREENFRCSLPSASLVITDSPELSDKLIKKYGLNEDRVLAMPFSIADIHVYDDPEKIEKVLKNYQINSGYFFYPAQFWPHKNHARIVEALGILKSVHPDFRVVFAGGDKGNSRYIRELAQTIGVEAQIAFLGFVPQEHMYALYAGCLAVLMPTYFGPTNIPPLEAWTLNKPLIYSSHLHQQASDAALYVDPDNANDISNAMLECTNPQTIEKLIINGQRRLKELAVERSTAEIKLSEVLQKLAARCCCWQ